MFRFTENSSEGSAGPADFAPLEQLLMMRFKGESWELFGPLMSGEKS